MNIRFAKMHGLGNDFLVVDAIHQNITWTKKDLIALARRERGVGFDQCLILEKSQSADIDFNYRIFNADGNEVAQCGNGARCLALFASHYGLTNKKSIRVKTHTSVMTLTINPNQTVSIEVDSISLKPLDIPLLMDTQKEKYTLKLSNNLTCEIHAISVGNPHAIILVDDITLAPVTTIGKEISKHVLFPEEANAGFIQIMAKNHLKLRVYERGCGETQACGSGAMAAALIARLFYGCDKEITVSLPGGDLLVSCPSPLKSLTLTGPATFVYEGALFPGAYQP